MKILAKLHDLQRQQYKDRASGPSRKQTFVQLCAVLSQNFADL